MVILLSFLSSTEQQQNNVIIAELWLKFWHRFHTQYNFSSSSKWQSPAKIPSRGLYACIWLLLQSRSRGTLEWLQYSSAAVTLRVIKFRAKTEWPLELEALLGNFFSSRAQVIVTKVYNWSVHYLPRCVLVLHTPYLEFPQPSKVGITTITHIAKLW